ncbi:uncharacterized protein BDR25DRAFT_291277 [Lindgomyces ingoldianus]|uniref:Uncharacterized protein n=1 Tax=Lindgomyces ingoldianus TaxID=673940 RepID=A0ACB6QLK3_9PLEO|nr:uncharacterized protein BDR25DRAFT_291277 [Lindgomyces ingoldianus]KAF2467859.1 hypothetical protein BDR25DRAFT_291277 [Lindgomyces ingoldianus]
MATATASKIHLVPELLNKATFSVPGVSKESAETTNRLLQENHEKYHIFFNQSGFHNHIAHHLLTIYALGASPSELKKAYDNNASYQRPPVALEPAVVADMHVPERYKSYLGDEKYYHDFLVYFKDEIEKKGWQEVVNDYVFKGDERADDMLVRMFGGFLHPLIHLGFGIEFQQPAIIAEALAQAAVHGAWMGAFFHGCEATTWANSPDRRSEKTIIQLLDEIRGDEKLREAPHWGDGNKIRDGIFQRGKEEMIRIASQYFAVEEELDKKVAEMVDAVVYYTAAAQHPPSIPKIDFFYMHCVNSSIFFFSLLSPSQTWLSTPAKIRLLEWKVRADLAMYASRRSPPLLLEEITEYIPMNKNPQTKDIDFWANIFSRARRFEDDGHASKLIRALAKGENVCVKFEGREGFVVQGTMWKKVASMVMDSVEAGGPSWVRGAGFEEAWEEVPLREAPGDGVRL